MTDALALAPPIAAPAVTREQLDLVKQTVAVGATDAQLKLFLYDCQRRGVHPLDRLIHFSLRGGRYTPISSIDYLRTRAADTGEMAGSDDARFDEAARAATVTVYRLTHGTRYAYTATARYMEFVPEAGPSGRGDLMWRKMPHVMLGKCAEAAALRKAFPQQLGGLYVKEELEQGRPDFTTEATSIADQYAPPPVSTLPPEAGSDDVPRRSRTTTPEPADDGAPDARDQLEVHHFTSERLAALGPGVVLVTSLSAVPTKNPNVTRTTIAVAGGPSWPLEQTRITTINDKLAARLEAAWHTERAIKLTTTKSRYGYEVDRIEDVLEHVPPLSPPDALPDRADEDPIPF